MVLSHRHFLKHPGVVSGMVVIAVNVSCRDVVITGQEPEPQRLRVVTGYVRNGSVTEDLVGVCTDNTILDIGE